MKVSHDDCLLNNIYNANKESEQLNTQSTLCAAWADITLARFSVAHPEFILIDITELILNWFF